MTAQPLFQFGTVTLNPTPDRRVIRPQTAFGEQLFDIAERERVPKIPAHGTQNQLRRRLPPLEDCRSGCVLHNLFRLPIISSQPKLQHINCIHIIPILRAIEQKYPEQVVVVGVHSPKFANERNTASVKDAIERYEIHHPIIHDPKMTIWNAYAIQAWPTLVVIGADGNILEQIPGEPDRDRLIAAIGDLVDKSASAGTLKPARLDLEPLAEPKGRFLFPGKLKAVPGAAKRWALADGGHNQIVLLDDHGNKELSRFGSGEAGLLDGAADKARFDHPQGLIASTDAIFVADTGNHAIRRIDLATRGVTTLAGTGQRGRVLGSPQPGRTTALASPWDLEKKGDELFFANAGSHQLGVLN